MRYFLFKVIDILYRGRSQFLERVCFVILYLVEVLFNVIDVLLDFVSILLQLVNQ